MLNPDQEKALTFTKAWWFSDHQCMVLDGKGGTGKTHLVETILKTIPNINPIILAPTHEALKQLKEKISGDYLFKTAHSALGIAPIEDEKELKFDQLKLPSLWDSVNLVVFDEASMAHEFIRKLLVSIGIKILFIGHRSQLPPVSAKRKVFDKCVSPVFEQGYPTTTLTIPQRNTGKLWEFNNLLDDAIYEDRNIQPPTWFDIQKKDLGEYVHGKGKDEIFSGTTKIVLWTNNGVDSYNDRIRKVIFGEQAKERKYLPGDKIILTKPYTFIHSLERHTDSSLKKLINNKDSLDYFYSNAKAEVLSCEEKIVKLNNVLAIPVYKININCEGTLACFYEPIYYADHDRISQFYEHIAWGFKDQARKGRAFRERNLIRSCFAHVKFFYAATAHRLQGSTIDKVIVINSDIEKNPNAIERRKCRYVACSRAKDELMFYRGL